MVELPTGTVTFLFTDIAGSTQLLQRLGDAYAHVLGEHQQALRAAFAAHDGVEVDTQGDAFFVAFPSAPVAVAAAAMATRALAAHPWPEGGVVRVRMGLHTGAPALVGDHYVGLDVHRAARIAAAGHGGQILLSEAVVPLVRGALPKGSSLRDVGAHRLKDLQQPEHLTQLVLPGLPSDFPPLKTLDTHPHNLAIQPTPLLGREQQVAALCAQLRREEVRLLTLTGPGGIGKTRLAVQVAAELIDAFADGVYFVRLSRLVDPALVVPTIAHTLGLKEAGSEPLAELLREHLVTRQLLVVLDNFEQVVGAATEVSGLLAACPSLKVLVTSRVALHLRAEHEYTLAPLSVPDPAHLPKLERLSQYAAVALFVERAQAAKSTFTVTAANAPAIAEICARLDGLPLAIELAAARVRVLSPEALLARLAAGLSLLTGGARDLEERQQTMRAAIAWSYDLLPPEEQRLFQRLAVFVGGCTLEAAEAVCLTPSGAEPLERDLLDGLQTLVEHSLVQEREEGAEQRGDGVGATGAGSGGGSDEPRFGLLHTIREYALEQLGASGEAEALRRAHAHWFLALTERAEPELTRAAAAVWLDQLERDHDNLRAALGWAREQGEAELGLRLVGALWRFWTTRGHLREGRAWVDALLPSLESAMECSVKSSAEPRVELGAPAGPTTAVTPRVRARALLVGGSLAYWLGDATSAQVWLQDALLLARDARDPQTAAAATNLMGVIAEQCGELERAAERFHESHALFREAGDRRGVGVALNNLGGVAVYQGDLERAAAKYAEVLTIVRAEGDRQGLGFCLINLSWVARLQGELPRAEALGCEALALFHELGDPLRCAAALE